MAEILERNDGFAVLVNSDLTEGRGRTVVKAVCKIEATALRLAKRAGVQGQDGQVAPCDILKMKVLQGTFTGGVMDYGPVNLELPTREDSEAQASIDAKRAALARARKLGLTEDEIRSIRNAVEGE